MTAKRRDLKHFVDAAGDYLGAFDAVAAAAEVPNDAVECDARTDPDTKWNGSKWVAALPMVKARARRKLAEASAKAVARLDVDALVLLTIADVDRFELQSAFGPTPDETDFPMIASRVGSSGVTDFAEALAQSTGIRDQLAEDAAAIQAAQLAARDAIDSATTAAEVRAVFPVAIGGGS